MARALELSDKQLPNSFFNILLISMPTSPECKIVHVCVASCSTFSASTSRCCLLTLMVTIGLFAKMIKYGSSLGMQDVSHASLNYQA